MKGPFAIVRHWGMGAEPTKYKITNMKKAEDEFMQAKPILLHIRDKSIRIEYSKKPVAGPFDTEDEAKEFLKANFAK
jgi:hypothetical protein